METVPSIRIKLNTWEKIIFVIIIINAIFLIFYQLGRADSYTDGSHYSMRTVGYLDYLVPYYQTSPIQWFDKIPWWGLLSFHDAPPLVFIIQHAFFKIFGENTIAMRLPTALAGLGTLILLYFTAKKMYGKHIALISMAALSLSTLFVWSSRISYLEGVEVFFITLSLYLFFCALGKDSYFIWFGIVLGLTFITKYTSFYLLLFIILFLLIKQRSVFLNKKFILGMVSCFIIISPVIFYNIEAYKTRGHFDVQFSHLFPSMFDAAKKDWPSLYNDRPEPINVLNNFWNIWSSLKEGFSLPLYYFILSSLLYLFIQEIFFIREKNNRAISLAIFCAILMFLIISPTTRYMPVFLPLIAMALGVFTYDITYIFSVKKLGIIGWAIFIILFGFEYVYNYNTNHHAPLSEIKSFFHSNISEKNLGYNQLEKFLKTTWENEPFYRKEPEKVRLYKYIKLNWDSLKNYNFYLFDFDLNWFARIWYFNRQWIYHDVPFMGDSEFVKELVGSKISPADKFLVLKSKGIKNLYYIVGKNQQVYFGSVLANRARKNFVENFERDFLQYIAKSGDGEVTPIYNLKNEEVFRVYRIRLN